MSSGPPLLDASHREQNRMTGAVADEFFSWEKINLQNQSQKLDAITGFIPANIMQFEPVTRSDSICP